MIIDPPAPESREKLTARLRVKLAGDTGYLSAGNVASYSISESRDYVDHQAADLGVRFVDDAQPNVVRSTIDVTVTEFGELVERMLHLSGVPETKTQAAASAQSASFTGVRVGHVLSLGAWPVANVVVEVDSVALTLDTDYALDPNTGEITILRGGSVENGDDVDVDYDVLARGYQELTSRNKIDFRGDVIFQEFNQQSAEPLRVRTGPGVITMTAFPEQSGEFGTVTLQVLFIGAPTIRKRFESTDLEPDAGS